jgi:hypothetical protein
MMSVRLLLISFLIFPRHATAQDPSHTDGSAHFEDSNPNISPRTESSSTVEVASYREDQGRKEAKDNRVTRVGLEALFGLVGNGIFVGSLYGAAPWFERDSAKCKDEEDCAVGYNMIPGVMGLTAGVFTTPLGVYLGGELVDGNGSYYWTFLGHLGGIALAVPTSYLLRQLLYRSSGRIGAFPVAPVAAAMIFQLAGAITAYELSARGYDPNTKRATFGEPRGGLKLVPLAALTSKGIFGGVRTVF